MGKVGFVLAVDKDMRIQRTFVYEGNEFEMLKVWYPGSEEVSYN